MGGTNEESSEVPVSIYPEVSSDRVPIPIPIPIPTPIPILEYFLSKVDSTATSNRLREFIESCNPSHTWCIEAASNYPATLAEYFTAAWSKSALFSSRSDKRGCSGEIFLRDLDHD